MNCPDREGLAVSALVVLAMLAPCLTRAAEPIGGSDGINVAAAGGTLGVQTGNGVTQFRMTAEGQYGLMKLQPQVELDAAGHIGLLVGDSTTFEIVPAARVRYLADQNLSFYGDGGLGIAFASSSTWGILRFAAGAQYRVTPQVSVMVEPVGLNIYFGSGAGFQYGFALGALYAF